MISYSRYKYFGNWVDAILAQVLGSSSRLFLLGVAFSSGCSLRPMPEAPRGVPSNPWEKSGREGNGRTRYGTHSPYIPLLDKEDEELVFLSPRSFFCNGLLFRLFYSSVSRQTRNTKGKSPGPMQVLTGVEEVGGRSVGASARSWLQLG